MMKIAAALFLLAATPAFATDTLPPDLAQAAKDYDAAQIAGNVPELKRLVADDYVLVNSSGVVENKAQFMDDSADPNYKVDPYVVEQPVIKVMGASAVMGGLVHFGWTLKGKHETRVLRFADIWAKRGGRWQVTYTQVTRVP